MFAVQGAESQPVTQRDVRRNGFRGQINLLEGKRWQADVVGVFKNGFGFAWHRPWQCFVNQTLEMRNEQPTTIRIQQFDHFRFNAVAESVIEPIHAARNRCPTLIATARTGVAGPAAAQNHQPEAAGRQWFCSEDLKHAVVEIQVLARLDPRIRQVGLGSIFSRCLGVHCLKNLFHMAKPQEA